MLLGLVFNRIEGRNYAGSSYDLHRTEKNKRKNELFITFFTSFPEISEKPYNGFH